MIRDIVRGEFFPSRNPEISESPGGAPDKSNAFRFKGKLLTDWDSRMSRDILVTFLISRREFSLDQSRELGGLFQTGRQLNNHSEIRTFVKFRSYRRYVDDLNRVDVRSKRIQYSLLYYI